MWIITRVQQPRSLPFADDFFDVVIAAAVVEHLPFESRHMYVDEYYRVLRVGGVVGFWDIPNPYFPFESHSVGLPLISLLPPQIAYAYARLFKHSKMKDVNFPLFVRAGTGWRNSSYYELLPKSLMIDVADVSEEFGYQSGCGTIRQAPGENSPCSTKLLLSTPQCGVPKLRNTK